MKVKDIVIKRMREPQRSFCPRGLLTLSDNIFLTPPYNNLMDAFQAKLVAAATGSTLTALTSIFYILPYFNITHILLSDSIRRGQDSFTNPAATDTSPLPSSSVKHMLPTI